MEDFLELGIEGVDKIIDGHFEKVPESAFHSNTYKPQNLKKKLSRSSRRNSARSPSPSPTDSTRTSKRKPRKRDQASSPDMTSRTGTFPPIDAANPYGSPPIYSREPPHIRPEYMPSPPPIGNGGYSGAIERRGGDSYYSDSYRTERPRMVTRRSSSYHGPRGRDYDSSSEEDNRLVVSRRRNSISSTQREKDHHHHGLKGEIEKNFTKSPAGITGGVIGAVVGGFVAKKAQTASGREGKHGNAAVTLLGAAVGGLAVNAIIDKLEDRRVETEEKQEKWEEKFGRVSDDESDSGRSYKGSRRERRRASRDRRDSRDTWDVYRDERRSQDRYD